MTSQGNEVDPYELLGVSIEATEGEIKTAYRQRSLKVHPDRHPNNPDAANKFHELNQAYELLLDPIRKTSLDASLRAKLARKQRFAKFDVKRKGMQSELEQAEREVKRAKMGQAKEERERKEEAERIKEEGRRMREERKEKVAQEEQLHFTRLQEEPIHLGPLDTTVRLKYPLTQHVTLTTTSALGALLSTFGPVDEPSIVISMKPPKKAPNTPPKYATALVPFKNIGDAFAAVCASGKESEGLKDIEVTWAGGKEPEVLEKLMRQEPVAGKGPGHDSPSFSFKSDPSVASQPSSEKSKPSHTSIPPSFSFDPSESRASPGTSNTLGLDYESLTMMRLRQAERERLEREIREQEAVG